MISACLLGLHCTYLGSANEAWDQGYEELIEAGLKAGLEFFPVCPEQLGGMPSPRPPAELQHSADEILAGQGKILNNLGQDVTTCFLKGARETLAVASRLHLRIAVLKSRSPSCGRGKVSSGRFNRELINGDGLTACILRQHGLRVFNSDDFLQRWRETQTFLFLASPS